MNGLEVVRQWGFLLETDPEASALAQLIDRALAAQVEAKDERIRHLEKKLINAQEGLSTFCALKAELDVKLTAAEQRVRELESALRDKPDQSDVDAAQFEINRLTGENARLRERLAKGDRECKEIQRQQIP